MGLQDLTPRERAALVLHDLLGWAPADVAELLDTNVEQLEGLLAQARSAYGRRSTQEARRGTTTFPASGPRMRP